MMTEPILSVKGLTKRYRDFTLDNISAELPGGCIMGLIGENGAGKTTLMKLILGLIRADSGEIVLFGNQQGMKEKAVREQVGVVFDDCRFHDVLNSRDVGRLHKELYANWDQSYFQQLCGRFSLPEKKTIKEFSKGMKMKLSIAAALAHHPKLLMLDEPTSGLDPVARDEILEIFLEFIGDEEHSVLFSSHITSDLQKIADYIAFMKKGSLQFCLSKDEVREKFTLLRCGTEFASSLDQKKVAGVRRSHFGCEVLLRGGLGEAQRLLARSAFKGDAIAEAVTLDDIMLIYGGK